MRNLLVVYFVLASSLSAQAAAWEPAEHVLIRVPPPSTADLNAARFGTREWQVHFKGEALIVSAASPQPATLPFSPAVETASIGSYGTQPSEAIRVADAWFLAYYHGEFGGALWQFNADGSVGRMLLGGPTYGLTRYGDEVLAETGSAAPFFFKPLRIHRFKLRNGRWQEVGHVDFEHNIVRLTRLGRDLYGVADLGLQSALVKIELSGKMQQLWTVARDLNVRAITRPANGDFAIGADGYVIRLRRKAGLFTAQWYAPRDCVRYTSGDARNDQSRCIGMSGVRPYERHAFAPIVDPQATSDGRWLLSSLGSDLLHFNGAHWIASDKPPLKENHAVQIGNAGRDPVLLSDDTLWLRLQGQWHGVGLHNAECETFFTVATNSAWCLVHYTTDASVVRIGFDGTTVMLHAPRSKFGFLSAGLFNDAWLSENAASFIVHATSSGLSELPVSSPITTISRGTAEVWFTEQDRSHYGYIDTMNQVHEVESTTGTVESINGAQGAWLKESFSGLRNVIRHIEPLRSNGGPNVLDVRTWLVAADGSLWAESAEWSTIMHLTEAGNVTRYRLPCVHPGLRLLAAPLGIWFLVRDSHCSGIIDGTGIYIRDLPSIPYVQYK